jgi:ABC-2 type transport system ATP-binding protein
MAVAESLCDWILMIHKGRKVLDGTLRQIQEEHGRDMVRVRLDWPKGADRQLKDLPGVALVTDLGNSQQMRLAPDADPQKLLEALMGRARVDQFEVARPSLKDIFLQIAGGGEA